MSDSMVERVASVTFEYVVRAKSVKPNPMLNDCSHWRAHIITADSDHHGMGETQAEALCNAAVHWRGMEEAANRRRRLTALKAPS